MKFIPFLLFALFLGCQKSTPEPEQFDFGAGEINLEDYQSLSSLSSEIEELKKSSKAPEEIKNLFASATKKLKETGIEEKSLKLFGHLPERAEVLNLNGEPIYLNNFKGEKILVLNFYRGHWCPYCMLELKKYQELAQAFKTLKAEVIAISPDSLAQARKTQAQYSLTFPIAVDPENTLSKQLNLAFQVDEDVLRAYKNFDINLEQSQNMLPVPAIYVIDRYGVVSHKFVDADYTKRAEPLEILKVVQGLSKE